MGRKLKCTVEEKVAADVEIAGVLQSDSLVTMHKKSDA